MKEATKKAASEAFAQTLAVTAMLVIASFSPLLAMQRRTCKAPDIEMYPTARGFHDGRRTHPGGRRLRRFTLLEIRTTGPQISLARSDLVADREIVVAVGHHAKALDGVDQNDVVGHMRAGLRRRGAAHQRRCVDRALAAGALVVQIRRAARGAEAAAEILPARRRPHTTDRRSLRRPWSSPRAALIARAPGTC